MKRTNTSLKLATTLAVAMIGAAPIALSSAANAAPAPVKVITKPNGATQIAVKPGSIQKITTHQNGVTKIVTKTSVVKIATNDHGVTKITVTKDAPVNHFKYGYDDRKYDFRHKPPAKWEHIPSRPSFAKYWRAGHWQIQTGHWAWIGGAWMR
ncbi:MAG TPA: hypothetical protein VHL34_07125 [Rhizomicrobium sp.]|jgi:hypothetical protein|nr:hypothetical protein [Rhizomicrobium sp.]